MKRHCDFLADKCPWRQQLFFLFYSQGENIITWHEGNGRRRRLCGFPALYQVPPENSIAALLSKAKEIQYCAQVKGIVWRDFLQSIFLRAPDDFISAIWKLSKYMWRSSYTSATSGKLTDRWRQIYHRCQWHHAWSVVTWSHFSRDLHWTRWHRR